MPSPPINHGLVEGLFALKLAEEAGESINQKDLADTLDQLARRPGAAREIRTLLGRLGDASLGAGLADWLLEAAEQHESQAREVMREPDNLFALMQTAGAGAAITGLFGLVSGSVFWTIALVAITAFLAMAYQASERRLQAAKERDAHLDLSATQRRLAEVAREGD